MCHQNTNTGYLYFFPVAAEVGLWTDAFEDLVISLEHIKICTFINIENLDMCHENTYTGCLYFLLVAAEVNPDRRSLLKIWSYH